jgi:hypothetical protein
MNRTAKTPSSSPARRHSYAFAALLLLAGQCAVAETLVVTRNDDPVPNGCLPGDCSLREAIAGANANANGDLIQVPAGNYGLPRGKLVLTGPVEIYGSNEGTTKVEGDGISQVFDILGAITVKLARLTIQAHGAHAVDAEPDSRTFLDFVTIPENDSQVWAGDANNSIGTLAIRASEIHSYVDCGNITACRVQQGSQIFRLRAGSGSNTEMVVSITDSVIDGDLAVGDSGAVIATNGEVTIANSTIQHTSLGLQILYGSPSQITLDHLDYNANDPAGLCRRRAGVRRRQRVPQQHQHRPRRRTGRDPRAWRLRLDNFRQQLRRQQRQWHGRRRGAGGGCRPRRDPQQHVLRQHVHGGERGWRARGGNRFPLERGHHEPASASRDDRGAGVRASRYSGHGTRRRRW